MTKKEEEEGETRATCEYQNSIKVSQNARGDRSWEVKVFNDDPKALDGTLCQYIAIAESRRMEAPERRTEAPEE